MKKNFTNTMKVAAMATGLVVAATMVAHAQDRNRDRGTAIIFTAPKADTISTNLHEVNVKQTPFKQLESDIRKPFEIFDSSPTQPRFVLPQRVNNAPTVNKSNLKAILEKSAEEQFLNGKPGDQDDPDDPFKSPDSSLDPLRKKPKTALDRYYDRLEKEQGVRTNKTGELDLFGNKKERTTEEKTALEANRKEKNSAKGQDAFSRTSGQSSNNAATDINFSRTGKKPDGGRFGVSSGDAVDRATLQRETRMDNFKKLLDGPAYTQPVNQNNFQTTPSYSGAESLAQRSTYLNPTPSWSSAKPASSPLVIPGSSFTKSSGIVGGAGRPVGLQDYATSAGASLSTPVAPIQQTKVKPSTYSPPTRR